MPSSLQARIRRSLGGSGSDNLSVTFRAVVACACTAALVHGYDKGMLGFVVGCTSLGGAFGGLFGGFLSDRIGRWRAVQLQFLLVFVSLVMHAAASTEDLDSGFTVVTMSRFVMGMGRAGTMTACIPYLQEVAPPRLRGRVISFFEILMSVGSLMAFGVIYAMRHANVDDAFRVERIIPIIICAAAFAGMWKLGIESPRWLLTRGRDREAKAVYKQLYITRRRALVEMAARMQSVRNLQISEIAAVDMFAPEVRSKGNTRRLPGPKRNGGSDHINVGDAGGSLSPRLKMVERAMRSLSGHRGNVEEQRPARTESMSSIASTDSTTTMVPDHDLRRQAAHLCALLRLYRVSIFFNMVMAVFARFTGGVLILIFGPLLLEHSGALPELSSFLSFNVLVEVMMLLGGTITFRFVDTFGRKRVLAGGIALQILGCLILVGAGLAAAALGHRRSVPPPVYWVGLSVVLGGYAIGFLPISALLVSEMFPAGVRGRTVGLLSFWGYIMQFAAQVGFLPMLEYFGVKHEGTFLWFVLALVNFAAFAYVRLCMAETKGKEPEIILADTHRQLEQSLLLVPSCASCCRGRCGILSHDRRVYSDLWTSRMQAQEIHAYDEDDMFLDEFDEDPEIKTVAAVIRGGPPPGDLGR